MKVVVIGGSGLIGLKVVAKGRYSELSPEGCAGIIREHLEQGRPATAFQRLAAVQNSRACFSSRNAVQVRHHQPGSERYSVTPEAKTAQQLELPDRLRGE